MGARHRYELGVEELDRRVDELVAEIGAPKESAGLVRETIVAALKLVQDEADRFDVKLARTSFKEMRHAFRVFAEYRGVPKVSMFGSARLHHGTPSYQMAERFARKIARRGYMVMTGGGPGIMEAGNKGAGAARSFGLGIHLPFEQSANPEIDEDPKLVNFRFFFTRKLFFVKEAAAIVLCPGGFGTLDEAFEALTLVQTGRTPIVPIVMMDRPGGHYWSTWRYGLVDELIAEKMISPDDVHLFRVVEHEDDAVEAIEHFYRNYHSQRNVNGDTVLRLKRPLSETQLATLNEEYGSILRPKNGRMIQSGPLPEEQETEPELNHLPRLVIPFDRRSFALLRRLIDAINGMDLEMVPATAAPPTEQA